jgi:hypothetical protein
MVVSATAWTRFPWLNRTILDIAAPVTVRCESLLGSEKLTESFDASALLARSEDLSMAVMHTGKDRPGEHGVRPYA